VLKQVRTLQSMLPKDQAAKLAVYARIRKKLDRHQDVLSTEERRDVAAWRPPDWLRVLTIEDLPAQIRNAFTEVDGTRGRLIGIDADYAHYSDWNGHDLLRMSAALRVSALGRQWVAASMATIFAGMLGTMIEDGPRVTCVAFAGVAALLLLVFGARGALPVLIAIAVGVAWLGGWCGALGLRLNFMSFAAVPITLGVGADYAANIQARLRRDGPAQLAAIIADTGSAVALCSLTTIIGYSSLLISHNRALRSFGLIADAGELSCLAAALLVLPALHGVFGRTRA
jgi:predicted exporter